jgi:hypothetical protein
MLNSTFGLGIHWIGPLDQLIFQWEDNSEMAVGRGVDAVAKCATEKL